MLPEVVRSPSPSVAEGEASSTSLVLFKGLEIQCLLNLVDSPLTAGSFASA